MAGVAANMMEEEAVYTWRDDFPALKQEVNGHAIAYLDSAASALKPRPVIEAMSEVMGSYYANIHRGLYSFSQKTTSAFEEVRGKIADFINAPSDKEIIFTRNATESINLVAQSWGGSNLSEGDEIILSEMEHHANIVPWYMIAQKTGAVLKVIPVKEDGTLDKEAFAALLSTRTKLVALVHISNAIGIVNNVSEIIDLSRKFNPKIKVLIDGSQAIAHREIDVQALDCDFYVLTGHKIYGPSGIGALWGRFDILETMPPYQGGGDMIETVSFDKITYKLPPARFEAGTPAIVDVIGLGAAIDYVSAIGMDIIAAYESQMMAYAKDCIKSVEGLRFYGTAPEKIGILSFTADWGHPSDIGMILDQCGVAIRTGHHCCQPLMARFGVDATARMSIGMYTNESDIDALVEGLQKARSMLA